MPKVAVVAGYGPGIGAAVSKRLATEGYQLGLLSRTQSRLDAAARELAGSGGHAKGYASDLTDPAAVKAAIASIQGDLGPVDLLFWNAAGYGAGLLTATPDKTVNAFNCTVTGLLEAVQTCHQDLKANQGAVLVTGAGMALEDDFYTQLGIQNTTYAVAKAGQRKLVHILHKGLQPDGIYVAEVTVKAAVRGTLSDPQGVAPLTPEAIADMFWGLLQARDPEVWCMDMGQWWEKPGKKSA